MSSSSELVEEEEGTAGRPAGAGLRRYLTAAVLLRLADEGARVGLVLLALQRVQSAGVGGMLVAALLIPHVVAAPGVGWLTDRARQPRVVVAVAAVLFATGLAGTAFLLGRLPLSVVIVVLLMAGCCGPALTGALTSQLSALVQADRLPRAYGADSLTYNVSGVAGPAVAGSIAGIWGATPALVTLAATALVGAAVVSVLPIPARSGPDSCPSPPLTAGVRAIVGDPVLATVTAASSLGQLGPGALAVVAAVLASDRGTPSATGWLLASVATGGFVGSLWWTWRPVPAVLAPRTVMLALLGIGVPLALAAAATASLAATAALFAVSGIFLGPFTGALFTTRQHHAPADAQAQVFSISAGLKTTAAAAGAALGGAIADLPTLNQLLLVAASPLLAGALGGLQLGFRTRRHRRSARHERS